MYLLVDIYLFNNKGYSYLGCENMHEESIEEQPIIQGIDNSIAHIKVNINFASLVYLVCVCSSRKMIKGIMHRILINNSNNSIGQSVTYSVKIISFDMIRIFFKAWGKLSWLLLKLKYMTTFIKQNSMKGKWTLYLIVTRIIMQSL